MMLTHTERFQTNWTSTPKLFTFNHIKSMKIDCGINLGSRCKMRLGWSKTYAEKITQISQVLKKKKTKTINFRVNSN